MTNSEDKGTMGQFERILDFAQRRFFRYGYSSITIDEIAAELRMSKSTVYRFFKSKDELLERAVTSYSDAIMNGFVAKSARTVEVFMKEFKAAASFVANFVGQLDPRARDDLRSSVPQSWKKLQELQHRSITFIFSKLLESGVEYGVIRPDIDPVFVGDLLAMSFESILFGDAPQNSGLGRTEALQSLADILFTGILATLPGNLA